MTSPLVIGRRPATQGTWRSVRIKDVCPYVNRGVAPVYADEESEVAAFSQKCVVGLGGVDLEMARPMEDQGEAASDSRLGDGDIVINSTGTGTLGRVGIIPSDPLGIRPTLVADGHVTILRTNAEMVDPTFLSYLLSTDTFYVMANDSLAVGSTNQMELGRDSIRALGIRVPDMEEQSRIVDYLNKETSGIDELVAEQERLLTLLAEHRTAAMSQAVACRIGGDAGDAGDLISGIGTLPTGWVVTPLGACATIQTGVTLGKFFDETTAEFFYLRVANVQDGHIDTDDVATIDLPEGVACRHLLRAGDVLMTEANGNPDKIGRGAVWNGEIDPCLHQNHVFAIRPDQSVLLPEYLALCMGSSWGRAYFRATSNQVGIATTNASKIRRFPLPLPNVTEQSRVLAGYRSVVDRISASEVEVQTQVRLLRERRGALITAAVTGQLDLTRSAA